MKKKMPFLFWVACGALIGWSINLLIRGLTYDNPLITQRINVGIIIVLVVVLVLRFVITVFKEMGWERAWWKWKWKRK